MVDIGTLIQYHRIKNQMTQKDLAAGVCSISYLSKVENGTVDPGQELLEDLSERLQVSIDQFLTFDTNQLIQKIMQLYKEINKSNKSDADLLLEEINETRSPLHNPKAHHLFNLIYLFYLLESNQREEVYVLAAKVLDAKESLLETHSHLYHKVIGLYYIYSEQPRQAYQCLLEAYSQMEKDNQPDADIYYLLAKSLSNMDQPAYSNHYLQIAIEQYIQEFFYQKVTDCYILFGINYTKLKVYNLAEDYFLQVLHAKPMMDMKDHSAQIQYLIGVLYTQMEKRNYAVKFLKNSLKNEQDSHHHLKVYRALTKIHFQKQEFDMAVWYLDKGEQIAKQLNHQTSIYLFELLRVQLEGKARSEEFINRLSETILPYFEEEKNKECLQEVYQLLVYLCKENGQTNEALFYQEKLLNLH
ncbi:helix-turn-helix domain-containing protein [Halalkalibacillus halophilus]|uniref:helix-turn-helix domain-containing protein n=1 Tax=Halalkalibacillus halophilus TaxID=392827 RepID=UPI0004814A94|nr:helix-turn-helix transcriptional regulator [Halalkalibacillus halophilus]